eukprot:jgi/Hompol1/438/HPOL_002497-RA
MGAGIAQVAAAAGFHVRLVDVTLEASERGRSLVATGLQRVVASAAKAAAAKGAASGTPSGTLSSEWAAAALDRVTASSNAEEAASWSQIVVEAVAEKLDLKRTLFAKLDAAAPHSTLFASNTSSLPIAAIAAATNRKDRFAGLHFFNPVPQMKLVEVIRSDLTSDSTLASFLAFSKALGKVPVSCKDTPGFIVNRLLVPYMLEATRLVERGEATKEDVDTAMKLGAGYPMGPFELMDYVGLDTLKFISDGWYLESTNLKGNNLVKPSPLINDLVASKRLGKKSGAGFYDYPAKKK